MKRFCFVFFFLTFYFSGDLFAQASENMNSFFNYDHSEEFNDCWGYVDANGREYAIVGTTNKILFFDITVPGSTVLVETFNNGDTNGNGDVLDLDYSAWRDFKTFGTKAYACADQNNSDEGLIVFDLSGLPNSVEFELQTTSFFKRAHNIFIDEESGWLYVAGARLTNGVPVNLILIDLNGTTPSLITNASIPGGYVHDLYVRNDTAYCSSGYDGFFVIDFTNPNSPAYLGSIDTEEYNHSSWLTDDGNYAFYAEEVPIGRPLGVIDLADFQNMSIDTTFKEPLLELQGHTNNRPHNPYVRDNLLIVSYYHDGVQVFDISDPLKPELIGYYDTFVNSSYSGYEGVWGVYPYYPSGNIIATDISNGFYVMEVINVPLPVELTHFSAKAKMEKIQLNWTTVSERNSDYFEIQKSADGVDFEAIARVNAAGDSDVKIDYQTFDEKPFLGNNYYRLKQVDFDGKFEYSEIEVVHFRTVPVEIFPSLITANEPLKFVFSENTKTLKIQLFSVHGQLMQSATLIGENGQQQELWLNDLPNGSYIAEVSDGSYRTAKRIVVVK